MDPRRLRAGEWIAGVSGVVLAIDLFLPWYDLSGTSLTANAWDAFAVNDVILMFVALFAIGLAVATAAQRTSAVPVAVASLTTLFAIVATVLVVVRLIWTPGGSATSLDYGAWFGLAACFGILLGGYRSMADERTPRAIAPKLDIPTVTPPPLEPEGNGA